MTQPKPIEEGNLGKTAFLAITAAAIVLVLIISGMIIQAVPLIGQVIGMLFLCLLFGIPTIFGLVYLHTKVISDG